MVEVERSVFPHVSIIGLGFEPLLISTGCCFSEILCVNFRVLDSCCYCGLLRSCTVELLNIQYFFFVTSSNSWNYFWKNSWFFSYAPVSCICEIGVNCSYFLEVCWGGAFIKWMFALQVWVLLCALNELGLRRSIATVGLWRYLRHQPVWSAWAIGARCSENFKTSLIMAGSCRFQCCRNFIARKLSLSSRHLRCPYAM